MKKKIIILVCFIIVLSILFFHKIYIGSSEKSLLSYNKKYGYENSNLLKKITINDNMVIFVNKNTYNNLYLIISNRGFLNNWKVTQLIGYFDINKTKNNNNIPSWDKLVCSKKFNGIYCGFFNNQKIKEINIGNKKCTIKKINNNLYMWYYFNDYNKNYKITIK